MKDIELFQLALGISSIYLIAGKLQIGIHTQNSGEPELSVIYRVHKEEQEVHIVTVRYSRSQF